MRGRTRAAHRSAVLHVARDGVITTRELVAHGVPESTVYDRCRDGGPWQLLLPGVVLLSKGRPTAWSGTGFLSRRWRAAIDAVRRIRSEREITELLADAVQHGLCTVDHLATELRECGRRGSATPRRVLRDVSAGARSVAERDAMDLWRRSGLPEPSWNTPVHDHRGALLGVADGWWDDVALAWEINSFAWHLSPEDYARETEKRARFTAAGVAVLPTLPTRLRTHTHDVIQNLESAYAHARSRPRPAVHALLVQQGGFTPTAP